MPLHPLLPPPGGGRTPELEKVADSGGAKKAKLNADGELDDFYVSCTSTTLKSIGGVRVLGPYDMDISSQDFFKALKMEFGERVFFSYQSFDGGDLGPLVKVESDSAFEDMKVRSRVRLSVKKMRQ